MEDIPIVQHPLRLGVTHIDINALKEAKKEEQRMMKSNRLQKVKIFGGYVLTTQPQKYKDYEV